jgi:hypothetical protein
MVVMCVVPLRAAGEGARIEAGAGAGAGERTVAALPVPTSAPDPEPLLMPELEPAPAPLVEPEPAPAPLLLPEPPPAPLSLQAQGTGQVAKEPPQRRPGAIPWTLLGIGLAGAAAGATLWALDGRPGCELVAPQLRCPTVLDTRAPGIALVSMGAAAGVAAVVFFGVELSQRRRQRP